MAQKSLFLGEDHAALYIKYRPNYPDKLYEAILSYLGEKLSSPYSQAVDVGCGSGQNTRALAPHFTHVLGTDISKAQIEQAKNANNPPNIQYRDGNFDSLYVPDGSAELVTCASSGHYFEPFNVFYKEVDRVLKPGGVLAMFAYKVPIVSVEGYDTKALTEVSDTFFFKDEQMVPHVLKNSLWVQNGYADLTLPYGGGTRVDGMMIEQTMPMPDLICILQSAGIYQSYLKNGNKGGRDPLETVVKRFKEILGDNLKNIICQVKYPTYLLMTRKP